MLKNKINLNDLEVEDIIKLNFIQLIQNDVESRVIVGLEDYFYNHKEVFKKVDISIFSFKVNLKKKNITYEYDYDI